MTEETMPGVHLVWLYRRRADLAAETFHDLWREHHARQAARCPQLRRYLRNQVLPSAAAPAPAWDGVAELWLDDPRDADALLGGRGWAEALRADERRFVDVDAVLRLKTVDRTIVAGAPTFADGVHPKRMSFFCRRSDLTREQALRYWHEQHGPLAASTPGLCRYVQSPIEAASGAPGLPRFDGVAQLWLDDEAALAAVVASALFRDVVKPDERNFVDIGSALVLPVREQPAP